MALNKPTASPPLMKNSAAAPVIFFDGVPVCGMMVTSSVRQSR
jgi:hypothetical protein